MIHSTPPAIVPVVVVATCSVALGGVAADGRERRTALLLVSRGRGRDTARVVEPPTVRGLDVCARVVVAVRRVGIVVAVGEYQHVRHIFNVDVGARCVISACRLDLNLEC